MVLGGFQDSVDDVVGGAQDFAGDVASGDVVGAGESVYTANDTIMAGILPGGAAPGGFARNFAPDGVTDAVDAVDETVGGVADTLAFGGMFPGYADSGGQNEQTQNGPPSWLLPAALAAGAVAIVVFGGDA